MLAVAKSPHVVSNIFMKSFKKLLIHFFEKTLGALWYWFRIECQLRGSLHIHGFCKLNEPNINLKRMGILIKKLQLQIKKDRKEMARVMFLNNFWSSRTNENRASVEAKLIKMKSNLLKM